MADTGCGSSGASQSTLLNRRVADNCEINRRETREQRPKRLQDAAVNSFALCKGIEQRQVGGNALGSRGVVPLPPRRDDRVDLPHGEDDGGFH